MLPLGTGNDLARVLGWGPSCDDDTQLPQILEKLERASTKMLDRWSIMTYEIKIPPKHHCPTMPEGADGCQVLTGVIRSPLANTIQLMRASRQVEVVGSEKLDSMQRIYSQQISYLLCSFSNILCFFSVVSHISL